MKKKSVIAYVPSPQAPLVIGPGITALLDEDFDETGEVILFEPPILATRRCGGHLVRLDDPEDEDE